MHKAKDIKKRERKQKFVKIREKHWEGNATQNKVVLRVFSSINSVRSGECWRCYLNDK